VAQTLPLSLEAGAEPLPGYRLLGPLGRGGFGEVWKCEVPGGLLKAVKFVKGGDEDSLAAQELESLRRVRDIRHPFILSLDRVEQVDQVLLIVMELADRSLQAVCADCQALSLPGVPRDELLGYLLEAAEALDWMNFGHDLQHLDVKPQNLFVVSNHLKVADFGLVHSLKDISPSKSGPRDHGLTPMYASPELLRGSISRHSDQYSLAVVYQQLLTGSVPFWHENPYQLMLLHLSAEPQLGTLPPADRPLVARALAKAPEERFPSCLDFLQSLLAGQDTTRTTPPAGPTPSRRPPALWHTPPPPEATAEKPTKSIRKVRPADATATPPPPPAPPPSAAPLETADRRAAPPPAAQATCVSVPGYRFLHCLGENGLGDLWAVEDTAGRELRALCLFAFASESAALIRRLQALKHPALPPTEVFCGPSGRVVLFGERFETTLRDRFEKCLEEGRPGVPRGELLGHLRQVAEALDALHREQGLSHLALNPRSLALHRGRVWLIDFGLVPLVWLPTGEPITPLNARYAAPGPWGKGDGPAADQYSLALIYAEMLTGIHPRPQRLSSGRHRRHAHKATNWVAPPRTPPRLNLDLLTPADRDVVGRALDADPARRYENCTAFVAALEAAGAAPPGPKDLYHCLPLVIPYSSLLGQAPAGAELPSRGQIVLELTGAADPLTVRGAQNLRYVLHPGGAWEYRCPVRLVPAALKLKVDGFRQQWNARTLSEAENAWVFQIELQPPRRFWEFGAAPPPQLEVRLEVPPRPRSETHLSEAVVRVQPRGGKGDQASRLLAGLGPQLFESLRSYLQASPEQRSEERWPCTHPLHVHPVLPDLDLAEALQATGKNISHGGINFRVPAPPPTDHVYLHWYDAPRVSAFAVLARVIRVLPSGPDRFEVGALFPADAPAP
jgi:serine/threonine protein kinase